jgi:hypothetical protein
MRNYGGAADGRGGPEEIRFAGFTTFRELVAYYSRPRPSFCKGAEGFVPLLEACFSLPVIAYLTGVSETLSGADDLGKNSKRSLKPWSVTVTLLGGSIAGQKERLRLTRKNSARLRVLEPFREMKET